MGSRSTWKGNQGRRLRDLDGTSISGQGRCFEVPVFDSCGRDGGGGAVPLDHPVEPTGPFAHATPQGSHAETTVRHDRP